MEYQGPELFPDFNSLRALANFFGEKSPETHLSGSVGVLQSWTPLASRVWLTRDSLSYKPHFAPIAKQMNWQTWARGMLMFRPGSDIVDCISCQPIGIHEVDGIDSIKPPTRWCSG